MTLRVLIAEQHTGIRGSLCSMLAADPKIEVVARVDQGAELLARAMQTLPDIVCIDIGMPGLNGIEATRSLLASQADVRVIVLSANVDPAAILELLDAGVAGYVSCDEGWKGLLRAILGVGRYQKTYLGPSVAADVLVALRAKRRALGALQARAADQGEGRIKQGV